MLITSSNHSFCYITVDYFVIQPNFILVEFSRLVWLKGFIDLYHSKTWVTFHFANVICIFY